MKKSQQTVSQTVEAVSSALAMLSFFIGMALFRYANGSMRTCLIMLMAGLLFMCLGGFLLTIGGAK